MNHESRPVNSNPEYGCELHKKLPQDGKEMLCEYRKKYKNTLW